MKRRNGSLIKLILLGFCLLTGCKAVKPTEAPTDAVVVPVFIQPTAAVIYPNAQKTFVADQGTTPYTFSILRGGGTVDPVTGVFVGPATGGLSTVRVTDANGFFADAIITTSPPIFILPATISIASSGTQLFTSTGGTAPLTYSVVSGGGAVNSSTGIYTGPATATTAVVRVTDSLGATADANVTVRGPLVITPATKYLNINQVFTFPASGGLPPYVYSVFLGGGTVNASTGVYTAPNLAGTAKVRVTDSLGATFDTTVTITNILTISPATTAAVVISVVDTKSFTTTGGVPPYTYSVFSGTGSITSPGGVYTPSSPGSITIRVTDNIGSVSDSVITVNPALTLSPTTSYVVTSTTNNLTAAGGVPGYTYAITSVNPASTASVIDAAGAFTSGSTTGAVTVQVTDTAGHTATSTVTIYNALIMSPTAVTLAINSTQSFPASGGVGSLTYSVPTGGGSITAGGLYTAPAIAGTATVRVQDTIGNFVNATVTIVSTLTINPQNLNLPVFSTATYGAILGTSPYVFSVTAGTGTISSLSGVYTAPGVIGTGTVKVTDAVTAVSTTNVTHIVPTKIASGSYHSCVIYNNGGVKCFGLGTSGQLGNGSTANIGSTAAQVGGAIPFVDLGTGRTAVALAAGIDHTCAILDNASLKCWGSNTYGQLGLGDVTDRGSSTGQMGDYLPIVRLGTGRTAAQVFAFGYETCVILDNSQTKCFGRNNFGQLGQDDAVDRGGAAGQMGNSLLPINLGAGRTATKMAGGFDFACARLDNATVKCFGRSNNGQLGYENTNTVGASSGDMASLVPVNLGTGRTVSDIAAFYGHTCVVLDNATVKCWGRNQTGQLGIGSTVSYGGNVGDMGNGLPVVPLTVFTPVKVVAGRQMSCASNAAGNVRCWGLNSTGQLMIGNATDQGVNNGEVAALLNINFGTGLTVSKLSLGWYFGCTILNNDRIKCFGSAANNALLNASTTTHLGDSAGELGDSLPFINH